MMTTFRTGIGKRIGLWTGGALTTDEEFYNCCLHILFGEKLPINITTLYGTNNNNNNNDNKNNNNKIILYNNNNKNKQQKQ